VPDEEGALANGQIYRDVVSDLPFRKRSGRYARRHDAAFDAAADGADVPVQALRD
jgi:hypothetical protein